MKGKILGCITYWSLTKFKVPRQDFRAALVAMGLGAAYGRDMSPKAVLTRAAEAWLRGHSEYRIKRLKGGIALLHSAVYGGRVVTTHVWTVTPSSGGALLWDLKDTAMGGATATVMRQNLEAEFQSVIDFATTSDLSSVLTSAMQGTRKDPMLSACNLRGEAGGVYFVPEANLEQFEKLRDYVMQQSMSEIARFWISDVNDNAAEVKSNVRQSVESELAELRQSVRDFAAECKADGREVGLKTINAREKRYEDLRVKVDLWADMLGDVAEEMRSKIAAASTFLKADLGIVPGPAVTPKPASSPMRAAEPAKEPELAKVYQVAPVVDFKFYYCTVNMLDNASQLTMKAHDIAQKFRMAGFKCHLHRAISGAKEISLVHLVDHPVMGTGVMLMRDGKDPEFREGVFAYPELEALCREQLSA